jgi:hypothetical protein
MSTILADSHSICHHAFSTDQGTPIAPGWHTWEVTRSREPGILLGGGWERMMNEVGGDVTQTRGWVRFALETGYQRAVLLAGIDDDGAPRAVAVGYVSESRLAALGFRTIRFPAYPSAARDLALVTEAVHACEAAARAHGCMSIEFLSGGQSKAIASLQLPGYRTQEKIEYVIDLTQGRDRLWTGLHRDQRHNVRYSERANVKVERMDTLEAVRALREIQAEVTRRHAVKGDVYGIRPRAVYDALHRVLITQGLARIYCAVLDGQIVMAALCSTHGGRSRGIHNGASQLGLKVRASTAVIWRIIEELSQEGYEELSLGIAEPSVEDPSSLAHGLHEFKLDLGAESRRVPFVSRELSPGRVMVHRALGRAASVVRRVGRRG